MLGISDVRKVGDRIWCIRQHCWVSLLTTNLTDWPAKKLVTSRYRGKHAENRKTKQGNQEKDSGASLTNLIGMIHYLNLQTLLAKQTYV